MIILVVKGVVQRHESYLQLQIGEGANKVRNACHGLDVRQCRTFDWLVAEAG